jgi:hypothetical protein
MLLVNYPLTLYPVHQMLESWLGLEKLYKRSRRSLTNGQIVSRFSVVGLSGLMAFFSGKHFGGVSMAGGAFIGKLAWLFLAANFSPYSTNKNVLSNCDLLF